MSARTIVLAVVIAVVLAVPIAVILHMFGIEGYPATAIVSFVSTMVALWFIISRRRT